MASKGVKRAPNKKKNANGYKLPEPIAKGEILEDMTKKQWIIGSSIGVGGFGEIYSAAPYSGKPPTDYPAVVKIEPHGNGPLFVEMHFYMRNAKPADIDAWKKQKKLSALGMPKYVGSGSHEYKNTKYRFVVMDRYSTDLWKLFEQNGRKFPEHTVYKIGVQIINVLEYIHNKTYVHADIKGGNLLLDLNSQNQVYLVDFGLASHYTTKPEYKLDPKKAHNGTIEYTSRDAHMGVPTMRSDFEILGYNMIQWLAGSLPWEKNLSDPVSVQREKEKAFENIDVFLDKCFSGKVPEPIHRYMKLLDALKFNDTPDYNEFRDILIKGLKKLGHKVDGNLEFDSKVNVTPSNSKKASSRRINNLDVVRKSPRTKPVKNETPVKSNLDESIYGLVIDKKHQTVEDMKKVLDSMDPDEVYHLQIKRKSNKRKLKGKTEEKDVPTVVEKPVVKRGRRKLLNLNSGNDDVSDSEPEVLNKGTKSRPKKVPTKVEKKKINRLSAGSESDIFAED